MSEAETSEQWGHHEKLTGRHSSIIYSDAAPTNHAVPNRQGGSEVDPYLDWKPEYILI